MKLSSFGHKVTDKSIGITRLMEDLARGLSCPDHIMLGGGNPSYIPEVLEALRAQLSYFAGNSRLTRSLLADYSDPAGDSAFRQAIAQQLQARYGWQISEANVALTNGSQSAFFALFNILAGEHHGHTNRHILFPLVPEYIGYGDTGIEHNMFRSCPPKVQLYPQDKRFKYFIDWDALTVDDNTAALCVSRPCNPTGNVITDDELSKLHVMAQQAGIPLIIDNAYGMPFPNIIFDDYKLLFDEHCILVLSLSKCGVPSSRTGIVVASEDLIKRLAIMNGVVTLTPSAIGPRLIHRLVESGELFALSDTVIQPFYEQKAAKAQVIIDKELEGYPCYLHKVEGGIFLWLWCHNFPISDMQLYQHLLDVGVTIVPGSYFFGGLAHEHDHQKATIRISYAGDDGVVEEGLLRVAKLIRRIYDEN